MSKYILTLILFLPVVLLSCSDDNENEGTDTNKTYKVRYEASCDNPNITMRIMYSTKNTDLAHVDEDAKIVYVKSPFSIELEMKYSILHYISAQAHDNPEIIDENTMFTTSIFVDGVKTFTATNKNASVSYYTLAN